MSCVNSDNFLAVALVINRSRDGPAFVFHYPPDVNPVAGDSGHDDTSGDLEDILLERLSQSSQRDVSVSEITTKHRHHDDHLLTESGSQIVPWEQVAGFPARDLASILTAAKSYHKKLFQLSLDPLYCVSCPIHVPDNGKWSKSKRSGKPKTSVSATDDYLTPYDFDVESAINVQADTTKDDEAKKDDADEEKRSSMTMFSLVFIVNPQKNETRELVDTLYSNIVKKVNKAYQYSQQHSDFVWKESKRILNAKDKAREECKPIHYPSSLSTRFISNLSFTGKKMSDLWRELIQSSSLAASIHDIYEAVSRNKIAALHLDTAAGVLNPSVQIPAPFYVADLPSESDDRQRGLWLTTANSFLSQEALEEPGFLDRNFALLLMDDEKKIIAELQPDRDPSTIPMVEFVRLCKPTMSLLQVAQSNVLTLSQVRKFAQHFIFWRRAIAIPPLHARDTYIVSPNCNQARLAESSAEWQRDFPLAPPLANFLSELSVCPRPYKSFCPSKVHRPLYLRMLAWLMRGGWVTQLCTFAYIVVWPELLYEVEYEMEAEELEPSAPSPSSEPTSPTSAPHAKGSGGGAGTASIDASTESVAPTPDAQDLQSSSSSSNLVDSTASLNAIPPEDDEQTTATTTEQTAEKARLDRIAQRARREAADKATAHARKTPPVATSHPAVNNAAHLAHLQPHIITNVRKATAKESRYLSAISRRFKEEKVKAAWQSMCKYFDGQTALERIALQEDMKRKETWNLLSAMSEYLLCTRHW